MLNRKNSRGRMCGIWFAAPTSGSQRQGLHLPLHSGADRHSCRGSQAAGGLRGLPGACGPAARRPVCRSRGSWRENPTAEIRALRAKIGRLTTVLDRMYLDQLSGLLAEADFARLYRQAREERGALERRVTELERRESPEAGDKAGALVQRFLDEAGDNRELLVSLIERVELTEQRELIIHFRFCPPEALFNGPLVTITAARGIAH
ncbi:hypothetical protein M5E87_17485 [Flavonifractor plautii]|nr:hypothetical protein M5E87_17485 [Flavonifractor plautii]